MALSSSILELGQRTRQRLEDERAKRAEIVVLDEAIHLPVAKRPKPSTRVARANQASVQPPSAPSAALEKSSVVRLEGLPKGGFTFELIRRFFSGLTPDRIVILPSFDVAIQELGESRASEDRILVRFPSSRIALVASQRSKEYILLVGGEKVVITVSIIPKAIGNHLLQNLGIDAMPGESLRKRRQITESNSLPSILNLLWTLAVRELKLTSAHHWMEASRYPWKQTALQNDGLQEYRAALEHEFDQIQRAGAIWRLEAGDPQVTDSVIRLYEIGCARLEREINKATNLILMTDYEKSREG